MEIAHPNFQTRLRKNAANYRLFIHQLDLESGSSYFLSKATLIINKYYKIQFRQWINITKFPGFQIRANTTIVVLIKPTNRVMRVGF